MPEGTSLEQTLRVLDDLSDYAIKIEEVKNIEIYAGNSAPINFNELVRQYYLRQAPHQVIFGILLSTLMTLVKE
jgi:multidrug efflux pump subunit AcrB